MNKFISNFWNALSEYDFFIITPSSRLTFQGQRVYSSNFSKLMTILTMVLACMTFLYFGLNMIMRTNPQTAIGEQYYQIPESVDISNQNFFIAFGMQNATTGSVSDTESYYATEMSLIKKYKNSIETIPIPLKHCEDDDTPLDPDLAAYFVLNPIKDMWCVDDYGLLTLQGSQDNGFYEYFSIKLNTCIVGVGIECQTQDQIDSFFETNQFYMIFTTNTVDPLNYLAPVNTIGLAYSIPTSVQLKPLVSMIFQHMSITTDDGIIMSSTQTNKGIAKLDDKVYYLPRKSTEEPYLEISFNLDKVAKTYNRAYDKLQDVVASTGGSLKIILILVLLISRPIITFNFYRDLGNEYFDYELPDKKENYNLKIQKLNIGIFEYLFGRCKRKDQDLQVRKRSWDQAKLLLDVNLSLSQILNKFVELEKLKFLLLEKEQLVLFERIPKPVLSEFDNTTHRKSYLDYNENFFKIEKKGEHKEAFNFLKQKKNKTIIDTRVLQLVKPEIEFLEEKHFKNDDFKKSENVNQQLLATPKKNENKMIEISQVSLDAMRLDDKEGAEKK